MIDKLDERRAQVYIESLIVEVSGDNAAEFGFQWQGVIGSKGSSNIVVGGTNFGTGRQPPVDRPVAGRPTAARRRSTSDEGLNIGLVQELRRHLRPGGDRQLPAVAGQHQHHVDAEPGDARQRGSEDHRRPERAVRHRPVHPAPAAPLTNPFQTIERKDVGITLRIKPQIGENGTDPDDDLPGGVEPSPRTPRPAPSNAGPTTNKRSIESNVMVDDGQILVLGGLIEDRLHRQQVEGAAARRHPVPRRAVPQRDPRPEADQPDGLPAADGDARRRRPRTSSRSTATT